MKTVKVDDSLDKYSGGSRLSHKKRLRPIIIVILVSVVIFFGAMKYMIYQFNSEKFLNAQATIEQLSEKYGYEGKYSLTVEERLVIDIDVTEGRQTNLYYLDRRELSKEDYVKYAEVRDYYARIIYTPYALTMLGTVLTILSLGYLASTLLKSYYKTKDT